MTQSARQHLADLLSGVGGPQAFSAQRTAPVGDLQLEVRGVGPLRLPVSQRQAKELCLLARPARYGRGEQTLVDRSVRDTWEIPLSRVRIDKRRWDRTLRPALERLGADLGLPPGRSLRAELHSMLVYAPGQFFVRHQDSEKADDMVGSLVVSLPSNVSGGGLEVQHHGERATYRGSKTSLSFVAFYSDCRHEVKPVTSGYRVVLTYNLRLQGTPVTQPVPADPELVARLARHLDEHFASGARPDRLVYLLDHEYTPRGLDWARLKGVDASRAELLRAAAPVAGCEIAAALADVHETWSAYGPERRRSWSNRSRRGGWYDDDDEEEEEEGDYELQELIESEITLEGWVDPSGGRLETVARSVGGDEVCSTTGSEDLEPYASEYEGYMGNWGNTLDRWYHRGAVVLWPRSRDFAIRAEASPTWALDALLARLRTGDLVGAQEQAATLAPIWARAVRAVEAPGVFGTALATAALLEEPALAVMLLGPFRLEMLTAARAAAMCTLVERYGTSWVETLVEAWSAHRRVSSTTDALRWIASLPGLCRALHGAGEGGSEGARVLCADAWRWLGALIGSDRAHPTPSRRVALLSARQAPLGALVEAAALVGAADVCAAAVSLLGEDDDDMVRLATGVLRAIPPTRWPSTGLDEVAAHVATAVESRLARPIRARDDWSIELPAGCRCALCAQLEAFCADRTETACAWPLAEDRRKHLHRRIEVSELPLNHETRRRGRPYTLVLVKTNELFERERRQRRRDRADLRWLTKCRAIAAARGRSSQS